MPPKYHESRAIVNAIGSGESPYVDPLRPISDGRPAQSQWRPLTLPFSLLNCVSETSQHIHAIDRVAGAEVARAAGAADDRDCHGVGADHKRAGRHGERVSCIVATIRSDRKR